MLTRPTDEELRRFAWTYDIDNVAPLFELATQRLAGVGTDWRTAMPFATTRERLGGFSRADWRRWIESVEATDVDGKTALARFAATSASRLGENTSPDDDLLQRLVDEPQERLGVELKPWLLVDEPEGIAKIARSCIALRNNNGGYLVLGFEDDGTPSPNPPPDVTAAHPIDRIQEIVSKYAWDPFAIEVEFRNRGAQTHAIIVVPEGVLTPVFARSTLVDPADDKKRLIEDDAIYVRSITSNNRVSSTKLRRGDIARLIKVCFDNREGDIGAFIRRHLPQLMQGGLDLLTPRTVANVTSRDVLDQGFLRFESGLKERGQHVLDVGFWEAAAVIEGLQNQLLSQDALYRFRAIARDLSGWPPWTIINNPTMRDMNPRIVNGTWEALMVTLADAFFGGMIDFWQISPDGHFYYVRALEDDFREVARGVEPKTMLDFYIATYRVTEAIAAVVQMSRELAGERSLPISFAFRWRGLKGRILGSWSKPGRMLRRQPVCYDDVVMSEISISTDLSESAIPSTVAQALRPLFLAFEGYEIAERTIVDIADEVLKQRM